MNKIAAVLLIAAVLSAVLISGCTQQPSSGGTGNVVNKAAEGAAQSAVENEMNQAIENISTSDIEDALLNQ